MQRGRRSYPAVLLPPAPSWSFKASGVMRAVWSQRAWLLLAASLSLKQVKSALLLCSQGAAALRALKSQREASGGISGRAGTLKQLQSLITTIFFAGTKQNKTKSSSCLFGTVFLQV